MAKTPTAKAPPPKPVGPKQKATPAPATPPAPAPATPPAPAPAHTTADESDDDLEQLDNSEDPFKQTNTTDEAADQPTPEEEEEDKDDKDDKDDNTNGDNSRPAGDDEDDDEDGEIQSTMETRGPLPTATEMPSVLDQEAGARVDARERLINGEPDEHEDDTAACEAGADLVDVEYVKTNRFCTRSHGKDNQAVYDPDNEKFLFCRSVDRNGMPVVPFPLPADHFADQAGNRPEHTQTMFRTHGEAAVADNMVIIQSSVPSATGAAIKVTAYARVDVTNFEKGPNKLEADIKERIALFPLHPPEASKLIKKQQSRVPKSLHPSTGKLEYTIISPKNEAQANDKWVKIVTQKPPAAERGRKRKSPTAALTEAQSAEVTGDDGTAPTEINADEAAGEDGHTQDEEEEEKDEESAPTPAAAPTSSRQRQPKAARHEPPNAFTCPPPSASRVATEVQPVTTSIYGNPQGARMQEFSVKEHKPTLVIDIDQSVDPSNGPGHKFSVSIPSGYTRIVGQLRVEL
jgi:hypothetical protein